jgi:formylglycine-generating enzyme required for sulfatase activity
LKRTAGVINAMTAFTGKKGLDRRIRLLNFHGKGDTTGITESNHSLSSCIVLLVSFFVGVSSALAQPRELPPDIEREIADYVRQIEHKRALLVGKEQTLRKLVEELLTAESALAEAHRQVQATESELESLTVKSSNAKKALDSANAVPELVDITKLEALRNEYSSLLVKQHRLAEQLESAKTRVASLTRQLADAKARKAAADREIDRLNRELLNLILRKPTVVEAVGECQMSDTITVAACREAALLNAKKDAIEKGGQTLIHSLSEVSMFELKKDELRAEATVQIRHLDILQPPTRVGEGEYPKYVTKIRVVVQSLSQLGAEEPPATPSLPPTSAEPPPKVQDAMRTAVPQALSQVHLGELPHEIVGQDGAQMVLVPAGEFTMGSNEFRDEMPPHRVFLDAFYIDKLEVTTSRFASFLKATGSAPPAHWEEVSLPTHSERPVAFVTWEQAAAYCVWAGKRLPTEAEWEKAAKGTDGRPFPWGRQDPTPVLANFAKCCDWKGYDRTLADATAHKDGESPYHLLNVAGNVREWVADWYDPDFYRKSPSANPKGPDHGFERVVRGGSWAHSKDYLKPTKRDKEPPDRVSGTIGFRCAKDAQ